MFFRKYQELTWWLQDDNLLKGVLLQYPAPLLLTTDASAWGWGGLSDCGDEGGLVSLGGFTDFQLAGIVCHPERSKDFSVLSGVSLCSGSSRQPGCEGIPEPARGHEVQVHQSPGTGFVCLGRITHAVPESCLPERGVESLGGQSEPEPALLSEGSELSSVPVSFQPYLLSVRSSVVGSVHIPQECNACPILLGDSVPHVVGSVCSVSPLAPGVVVRLSSPSTGHLESEGEGLFSAPD